MWEKLPDSWDDQIQRELEACEDDLLNEDALEINSWGGIRARRGCDWEV